MPPRNRTPIRFVAVLALSAVGLCVSAFGGASAGAAEPEVGLGTAEAFAVLAGAGVSNTGPSVLVGFDLGVSPGSAVTGFPPGLITLPGVQHVTDSVAAQAQLDATTAFDDAAGRSPSGANSGLTDLVGKTLQPGVYQGNALSLSGTVTLDNNDVPDAVFIFQAASSLITSSSSVVKFTNADHPSCNVFWEVGTSATLGTGSSFVGTLLAKASISATTGASIQGRLLASIGAVTLDTNRITRLTCAPPAPVPAPVVPTTATPAPVTTSTASAPPVATTPPPRDVTSGRTVPVTMPSAVVSTPPVLTSRSGTTTPATGPSTGSPSSPAITTPITTSPRTTGTTPAFGFDTGSGKPPGLAITGPPVVPLLLGALVLLSAGWTLMMLARPERRHIGQHRA